MNRFTNGSPKRRITLTRTVVGVDSEREVDVQRCIGAACVDVVDGAGRNTTDAEGRGRRGAVTRRRGERGTAAAAAADRAAADRVRRRSRPSVSGDTHVRPAAAGTRRPPGTVHRRHAGTVPGRMLIDRQHGRAVLPCHNRTQSVNQLLQALTSAILLADRQFSIACYLFAVFHLGLLFSNGCHLSPQSPVTGFPDYTFTFSRKRNVDLEI